MPRRIFSIIFFTCILFSCKHSKPCSGIENEKFNGNALIFYHKPVSGSTYEVIIMPTCHDSLNMIKDLLNNDKIKLYRGISVNFNSRHPVMREVFNNSRKFNDHLNDSFAPELRAIHICPVYIQFEGVQNDKRYITKTSDFESEKIIFDSQRQIILDYIYSDNLKIDSIRAFKQL